MRPPVEPANWRYEAEAKAGGCEDGWLMLKDCCDDGCDCCEDGGIWTASPLAWSNEAAAPLEGGGAAPAGKDAR